VTPIKVTQAAGSALQSLAPDRQRLVAFAAMVGAGAIAIGGGVAFAPRDTLIAVVAFVLATVAMSGARARRALGFGVLAAVPVVSGLAANGQLHPHELKLVSDAALAAGFVPLMRAISRMSRGVKDVTAIAAGLMIGGELVAALTSHAGLSVAIPAAWQDLRWPGAIGWGLYLGRNLTPTQRVTTAYRLLVAWNVCQTVIAAGEIALGEGSGTRFSLPVVSGVFGHPTLGAIAGTLLLSLVLCDALSQDDALSRRQRTWGALLALLVVIISTRLKPLLALAGLLVFVWSIRRLRGRSVGTVLAVAIPVTFFLALPFTSRLTTAGEPDRGLVSSVAGHAGPRTSLLGGAEKLANGEFPFGWGLGTFGSNISPSVEHVSFTAAGLDNTFGFSDAQPAFRYDSLMAHVLGERGWLGLILWMAAFFAALVLMVMMSPGYLFPSAVMAVALTLTPISPSIQDPTAAFLTFLPAGLCVAPSLSFGRARS
jgi:hypothetical protein